MRSLRPLRSLIVAAFLVFTAYAQPVPAAPELSQLRGIEELKSWFNATRGHVRVLFLLSPT